MNSDATNTATSIRQWWVRPGPDGGELELCDVPMPEAGPDEVLVRIRAAGVNRGELIGLPGLRSDNPKAQDRPSGIEFSGEIVALGGGVAGWQAGDLVMGRGVRCHADHVVVPARSLMATPAGLDHPHAAAIPNVFVTAHDALVTAAEVGADDRVLITAGSSGVGTAAIQIAKHLGVRQVLATTRSADKADRLLALGADHVIDTSADDWVSDLKDVTDGGVDAVIDQVGGNLFTGLMAAMALKARFVGVGRNDGAHSTIDLDLLALKQLHLIGVTFRTRTPEEALHASERFVDELLGAFTDGPLVPVLDRAFPLDELPDAHRYMLTNQQFGKVVLTI